LALDTTPPEESLTTPEIPATPPAACPNASVEDNTNRESAMQKRMN
jgi:hypothetical protein